MKKFFILITFFLIGISWANDGKTQIEKTSQESNTDNLEKQIDLAKKYHDKALLNPGKIARQSLKKAEEILTKIIEEHPDCSIALAWYGSILTLKGREAWSPLSKTNFVSQGIKLLDKAIKQSPNDIWVRMIRANNSLGLPLMFKRLEIALQDFEYLLNLSFKQPKYFNENLFQQIYLRLGQVYLKKEDIEKAIFYWQKVIEIPLISEEFKKAQKLLEEFKK